VSSDSLGICRDSEGRGPFPSRRQGHERNLPSLAAEHQLLPGPPGSLVLSANLQVLCGCLHSGAEPEAPKTHGLIYMLLAQKFGIIRRISLVKFCTLEKNGF